jgi:hypothetical protein
MSPHHDMTERGLFISALNALTLSLKGEREVSLNLPLSQAGRGTEQWRGVMKKDSLFTSDRCAGFATKLKGGYEMFQGSLINRLARSVPLLLLVAAIGHLTAAGVEVYAAPPPSHQDILNQIPPAWSQILPAADRFQLVMGGAAVLDRETGLVWDQSPETAPNPTTAQSWLDAQSICNSRTVGGRFGWRLPTLQELASLVDPNNPGGDPDLPPGHPFSNVQSSNYWSATTHASLPGYAWGVSLSIGDVVADGKTFTNHVWCVRGGQGVDPQ